MKPMPFPVLALLVLLAACGRQQAPNAPNAGSADGGASAARPATTAASVPLVRFENLKVEERPSYDKKGTDWVIRASLVNTGAAPLDGGEFVVDLVRNGEDQPFAVHSTQVFFSPAVAAGRSTSFIATMPGSNVASRPALNQLSARARLVKALPRPRVAAAWKPLDPATATPRVVGDTVIIDASGKRRVVAAPSPADQQKVADASNPFKGAESARASAKK